MDLENASVAVAGVGGRLLEDHQKGLGNQWRCAMMAQEHGDARMQPPPFLYGSTAMLRRETVLSLGGYNEQYRTNAEDTDLCSRLTAQRYTFTYLPEARAHHMREDTVDSVFRTWWNWYYWNKEQCGAFATDHGAVDMFTHRIGQSRELLSQMARGHREGPAYMALLHPSYDAFLDLAHGCGRGFYTAAEARWLHDALLAPLDRLDTEMGGGLAEAVRNDTAGVVEPFIGAEPGMDPGRAERLQPAIEVFEAFCTALQPSLYERAARESNERKRDACAA